MPSKRNPYKHAFTLTTRLASQDLFMEEVRCLLSPLRIRYGLARRKLTRNGEVGVFNLFITPQDAPAARRGLERLVSGKAMLKGTGRPINTSPLAIPPNVMLSPLFDERQAVRGLYFPTRGVTSAAHAALLVNLLGITPSEPAKRVLVTGWETPA